MAKELPFFKFEVSEWMLGRIQKQPLDVQGTFINLCCKYWHKLGELSHEEATLDFTPEHIELLIKFKIMLLDDGYLVIKFLDNQLDERKEVSRISSLKGKKSAQLRLNRSQQRLKLVEPDLTSVQPDSTEEKRREKKREEKIPPFDPTEFYPNANTAFEDIKNNELLMSDLTRIFHNNGFKGCNGVHVMLAVKKFLTIEGPKDEFRIKPKGQVKSHLINWMNKNVKELSNG